MWAKMKRGKRLYVFKSHKEQPDDEITLDYVEDHCTIHGSVNKVVDELLALREEIGDFGETRLCRHGLGRSGLGQALDAVDGRGGDAARQRRHRQGRGGVALQACSNIRLGETAHSPLVPANAGTQRKMRVKVKNWVPAFAGTSGIELASARTR